MTTHRIVRPSLFVLSLLAAAPAFAQTSAPSAPPAIPSTVSPSVGISPGRPMGFTSRFLSLRNASPSSTALPFANSKVFTVTYEQVQSYGRCISNVSSRSARGLLGAAPNSADERWQLRRISSYGRSCLPYGYRAPIVFLRGGVAEALYKRASAADALHARGSSAADLQAFQAAEDARSWARLADDRTFTSLANCLVVRAPAQTRRFLFSKPGSDAELGAIDGLLGAAPACTGGARFPRDGARTFLRAYVAESAYRWATFAAA